MISASSQLGSPSARGIFVAPASSMSNQHGGVQICTREYIATLQSAGFQLSFLPFNAANGLYQKIMRRIVPRPYRYFLPNGLADRIAHLVHQNDATHVFLNTGDLAPIAKELISKCPSVQIVMLSIGLESVDFMHTLRTKDWRADFSGLQRRHELLLGRQIIEECKQRVHIHKVLCLAEFEAEIEKWLGAREVLVVPRTITPDLLDWKPREGRVGYVGRLDHPPNLEGLLLTLDELATRAISRIEVRIVGAPDDFGAKLMSRYPFVKYLGNVSDAVLLKEASTWTCGVNPVFCFARGASTKLAVLISWGIPVVTTPQGQRGYEWRGGRPVIADSASSLGEAVWTIATDPEKRVVARNEILTLLKNPLGIDEIGQRLNKFLLGKK